MGTRSLTAIQENGREIALIYRQFDGYPTGMGADIKRVLKNIRLVNGFTGTEKTPVANGMGCLAAQLVKGIKEGLGNVYLYSPGMRDCGEEYVYTLYTGGRKQKNPHREGQVVYLRVYATYSKRTLYDGPLSGFNPKVAEALARF